MKKILFAIVLVIILGFGANAQNDAFFRWNGNDVDNIYRDIESLSFTFPTAHGSGIDYNAPLGSGIVILTALGAGYALARSKREE